VKGKMTKRNIYQKLHAACLSAGAVKKAAKANGMHFNPLLHDKVQEVATQALLDNGLYATCNYLTEIVPNIKQVMVVCTMKVYDVDDPTQHILVDGCSAFGNLDKFGTGNAMSYSRKYAFLNLLNLKTGIKDEDGYEPKPFEEDSTEQSVEEPTYMDDTIDVEEMKRALKATNSLAEFNEVKDLIRKDVDFLMRNNLRAYRQVTDIAETRELQLTNDQQLAETMQQS
jgi:tRNA isopentenyl-2-thiomethyl-A-37 hydroxylase MiaE